MRALRGSLLLGILAASGVASGEPAERRIAIQLDPTLGFPATGPQRMAFGVGGGLFAEGTLALATWFDAQLVAGGLAFHPSSGGGTPGLFGLGGGVRVHGPDRHRIVPFVDVDPLFVRTGDLNRLGYTIAAGVLVAVDRQHTYWLGFDLRYLQVVQPSRSGFDTTDADLILFGITSQLGLTHRPAKAHPLLDADGDTVTDPDDKCPAVAGPAANHGCPWGDTDKDGVADDVDRCVAVPGPTDNHGCPAVAVADPDRDKDGVLEPADLCPDKAGPADNDGCPRYQAIKVTRTSIELNQKIFFAYDKDDILPKSFGLMADVVEAFKDYPGLRVRIEGHTDSKGQLDHNMKLSKARAEAVQRYLVDHGVPAERITSAIGYGPTQPLDDNNTPDGRERNRRVEFVVEGLVVGDPAPPK